VQRELIEQTIQRSVDTLDLLLAGEMERAMMTVHAKPPRPKAPRPSSELLRDDGPAR
jgi:PTH1 family peptidyl-tRNA hydrolase